MLAVAVAEAVAEAAACEAGLELGLHQQPGLVASATQVVVCACPVLSLCLNLQSLKPSSAFLVPPISTYDLCTAESEEDETE